MQTAQYESRSVEARGVRLNYLDYGSPGRQPMLCVHGGAAHAHWFDFVAGAFTRDHHVIALDLRGHGDSAWVDPPSYLYRDYADDVAAFTEKLGLEDIVLVGHSMGGSVSALHTATYPARVRKLVIVDTTITLSPERITALRDIGSRSGRDYATLDELVERYRLRPGVSVAPPEVVRYVARHGAREFPDGRWKHKFDRNVYATRELLDGMPSFARIHVPTLLVKGELSDRITPAIVEQVKALCPTIEVVEVKASGHHVTLDNPEGFIDALRTFLAKHPN